jgi:protein TonB
VSATNTGPDPMRDPIHPNPKPPAISCWIATIAVAATGASAATDPPPGVHLAIQEGRVIHPRAVERVAPDFPGKARRKGVSRATVVVRTVIDREGRAIDPVVRTCAWPDLVYERAALKANRKWRFEPALLEGRPVDVHFSIAIDFPLDPAGGRPDRNH